MGMNGVERKELGNRGVLGAVLNAEISLEREAGRKRKVGTSFLWDQELNTKGLWEERELIWGTGQPLGPSVAATMPLSVPSSTVGPGAPLLGNTYPGPLFLIESSLGDRVGPDPLSPVG